MPLKNIVVDGCELDFELSATGDFDITGELSDFNKCDGKKAYKKIKFKVTNYLGGQIVADGTGEGEINGTALYAKIEGNKAVLENDRSVTITFHGYDGNPAPVTHSNRVYVKKAGQTLCKAP